MTDTPPDTDRIEAVLAELKKDPAQARLLEITARDFAPHVGAPFTAEGEDGTGGTLTLKTVTETPQGRAPFSERGPFSLLFDGPAGPGRRASDAHASETGPGRRRARCVPSGMRVDREEGGDALRAPS